MESMCGRRVPQIRDAETAVRIFYSCGQLGTKEVRELFGCCDGVNKRLRDYAREEMQKNGHPVWAPNLVNTDDAYAAWGLDIKRLESGIQRMKKLGLMEGENG